MSSAPGEPAPPAAGALDRVVTVIDTVSTVAGWFAGSLIAPLTLAVAYEVVARYVFNAPTRWVSTEALVMLYFRSG